MSQALDDGTWRRLRGTNSDLPPELQPNLSEEEATDVWAARLQAAVDVLAERFHSVYGAAEEVRARRRPRRAVRWLSSRVARATVRTAWRARGSLLAGAWLPHVAVLSLWRCAPPQVHVLGGNAARCRDRVTAAQYALPDSSKDLRHSVPVIINEDDATQQLVHMSGLVYSRQFKLKQVTASGQDPLARGWTRGGEIYLWVAKGKSEDKAREGKANYTVPPSLYLSGLSGHSGVSGGESDRPDYREVDSEGPTCERKQR